MAKVISDVNAFAHWFAGVNRRAVRDISSLPAEALEWRPPAGQGELAWSVRELIDHVCCSRIFFSRAYRGDGWHMGTRYADLPDILACVTALNASGAEVASMVGDTPREWLTRRVQSLDDPAVALSGWRLLMMMAEHDVHHRSQVESYAGLNGWKVQQIFGRTFEEVRDSTAAS